MNNARNKREISGVVTKLTTTILILALLALDWAALHDIYKGEGNLRLERAILIASIFLLAAFALALKRKLLARFG